MTVLPRRKKGLFSLKNFFFEVSSRGKNRVFSPFSRVKTPLYLSLRRSDCVTKKTDKSILIYIHRT